MQRRKIAQPKDWKALPYFAPYYLYSLAPDRLQIWVKPRYWFAAVFALVAGGWVFLSFLSYDTFDAILRPLFSVFVGENAKSKITDAYNLRFWLMLPIGFFLGAAIFHYKRRGLVEVAPEGIWIVDDPRFSPEGARLIERADILGFDDGDLYTSTGKFSRMRSGTELKIVMHVGKGSDVPLLKIWGVDALNKKDYHDLRSAIEKAFAAGKKSHAKRKPGEPYGEPVPGPTHAELARSAGQRKRYLAWEKIYLLLFITLFAGHFVYSAFIPLGYRLDKNWWLYALACFLGILHAHWFVRLWGQSTMWRVLGVWPLIAVAAIWPAYLAYNFQQKNLGRGISLWGKAIRVLGNPPGSYYKRDMAMEYTYNGIKYNGICETYDDVKAGQRLKIYISAAYPRIYECDGYRWKAPGKKKNRKEK